MSYHKVTQVNLLQPIRFLVNITILVVLMGLVWTPPNSHNQVQTVSLIVAFCIVFAAGIVNMLELFCYFYFGNHICLSKPPAEKDPIELRDLEEGPTETKEEEEANNVKEFGESTKEERVTLLSNGGASQEEQNQTEEPSKDVEIVEENKIKSDEEKNDEEEGSHKEEACKTEPVELRKEPTEDKTED